MNTHRFSLNNTRHISHARRKGRTSILLRKGRVIRRYKDSLTRHLQGRSRTYHLTNNGAGKTHQHTLQEVRVVRTYTRRFNRVYKVTRSRNRDARGQQISATRGARTEGTRAGGVRRSGR